MSGCSFFWIGGGEVCSHEFAGYVRTGNSSERLDSFFLLFFLSGHSVPDGAFIGHTYISHSGVWVNFIFGHFVCGKVGGAQSSGLSHIPTNRAERGFQLIGQSIVALIESMRRGLVYVWSLDPELFRVQKLAYQPRPRR